MLNILFYGNCQIGAIKKTINLQNFNNYNIACHLTNINKYDFTNIIKKCDIVITQSIRNDYRNKNYLSTKYIIDNVKERCKIIIVDSFYFDFYYFDLIYKKINRKELKEPIPYHYNKMIETYVDNLPIDHYINNYVNNVNLKTKEELEKIANDSLDELERRYNDNVNKYSVYKNICVMSVKTYIENNYRDKLLFYSMNHPTKYIIQYICEEITKYLKLDNNIDYNIDCLNGIKCIIYKCVQQNVNFDINDNIPLTRGKKNIRNIVKLYYDTYKRKNITFT